MGRTSVVCLCSDTSATMGRTSVVFLCSDTSATMGRTSVGRQSLRQRVSNMKHNAAKHFARLRKAVSLQRLNHTSDSPQHDMNHTQASPEHEVNHTSDSQQHEANYQHMLNHTPDRPLCSLNPVHVSPCNSSVRKHKEEKLSVRSLSMEHEMSGDVTSLLSWRSSTSIDSPRHFRPIGRVLSYNSVDDTTVIELTKPQHGPYGFYLSTDTLTQR